MGRFDKLFGRKKKVEESTSAKKSVPTEKSSPKKSPPSEKRQPEFVRKYSQRGEGGTSTYEMYRGTDAESAKDFLLTKRVDKRLYYIVVETPEGNWGVDIEGLYIERLLPWQTNTGSAKSQGVVIPMSWSMFGLNMAARGLNDNFVAKVQCGKCEHQWLDAIRYRNITAVRCPNCKTLNKVDSNNIQVLFGGG